MAHAVVKYMLWNSGHFSGTWTLRGQEAGPVDTFP